MIQIKRRKGYTGRSPPTKYGQFGWGRINNTGESMNQRVRDSIMGSVRVSMIINSFVNEITILELNRIVIEIFIVQISLRYQENGSEY